MAGIEEKVREIALPFIEAANLELWGIRYRGGRDHAVLQIFVEGPNGVGVDECGELSNLISPALDVADPIAPKYTLEISSPGMDRILFTEDQAARFVGSQVKFELQIAQDGKRKFTATLQKVEDGVLTVLTEDSLTLDIAFANILLARLVPVFENPKDKKGNKKAHRSALKNSDAPVDTSDSNQSTK